ncbi:transmembrane protein 44 [Thalassophryne amazonica]|uniref:transmembrane protein 44 n=1 Tax=Thalassophryne amazonica TaxID=390379 RepID=UPI00147254C4|nr:transmembrane protein 44 [Thalassophryne amazonica]
MNVSIQKTDVRWHTLNSADQTTVSINTFVSGLLSFCVESLRTCLSNDADKLCLPVVLCALSALLLLPPCLVLVCQRCTFQGENRRETATFFYCFLGNLCGTTGAVLSRQLYILVLMSAFAAAVDAVNFLSCVLSLCLCWKSKTVRRLRAMRRRRRQHLLAMSVLMVFTGGYLRSRVRSSPADWPPSQRRLLHVTLHQDNTEVLGYILGLLAFIITCTSKFPGVCRAHRGQMVTWAHMISGGFCSLASALYASAILLSHTQFGFVRVMPWLLSAVCSASLQLLILIIHCNKRLKRGTTLESGSFSTDNVSLLGELGSSTEDTIVEGWQAHSSAQIQDNFALKMNGMGHYMDVSIQSAPQEVSTSEEKVENLPLNRTVQLIRVNSFCSLNLSDESSQVSSDLEWDFEEANAQWKQPTKEHERFPLREWLPNPKIFSSCICAASGLSQYTLSGKMGVESGEMAK